MKKKILFLVSLLTASIMLFNASNASNIVSMPNVWSECGKDMECAQNVAGFDFLILPSTTYTVRAMKGMIEIHYNLDETRNAIIRKSNLKKGDISGVYTKYPIKNKLKIKNNISVNVRGTNDKIFVAYIGKNYSIYCKDGFTIEELVNIYDTIFAIEAAK